MSEPYRTNNPTEFGEVDGIIIDERAPAPNVTGIAANVACLVGRFQRGPANLLKSVGSIGDFHQMFGRSDFSGNKELKNKRFGSLRIIRAVASDAVLAELELDNEASAGALKLEAKYVGAYGNSLSALVRQSASNTQQSYTIETVADVAGSLDAKFFTLQDVAGSVAFWINLDDGATTIPSGASSADRAVEITTIETGDAATAVATKIAAAVNADAQFSSSATSNVANVTSAHFGALDAPVANDSGFTMEVLQDGAYFGHEVVVSDDNDKAVLSEEVYLVDMVGITQPVLNQLFAGSLLVNPVLVAATGRLATAASADFASGSDGIIADTDYEAALAAAEEARSCNVMWADKYSAVIRTYFRNHLLATRDKMAVICLDNADLALAKPAAKTKVIQVAAQNRDTDGRLILGFNPVKTFIDGVEVETSPASWIASTISNTSPSIDPAFAENAQFMQGATGLKHVLNRQDYIDLVKAGVAAFESDPDVGLKLRSGVTTQIIDSSKTQVLRRRMADFLTGSVGLFLKNYQNAPNTKGNRSLVGAAILGFDEGLIAAGVLPGNAEVQDGLARLIDTEGANTDLSIGQGFFKIIYKRRIFSSMRFIILQAEIGETVVVTEGE